MGNCHYHVPPPWKPRAAPQSCSPYLSPQYQNQVPVTLWGVANCQPWVMEIQKLRHLDDLFAELTD